VGIRPAAARIAIRGVKPRGAGDNLIAARGAGPE
jgi:hypothetical protein